MNLKLACGKMRLLNAREVLKMTFLTGKPIGHPTANQYSAEQ
jgi:hypothetical protein